MAGTLIAPGAVLREDLGGEVMGWDPSEEGFVGGLVLPPYGVSKRSGEFNKLPAADFLKRVSTKRRPSTAASRSTDSKTRDTWNIKEYAHEKTVDPSNTDAYRDLASHERAKAMQAALIAVRDYEADVASALYNETTFPASGNTGYTLGTPWTTYASAVPIQDVMRGHRAHKIRHGRNANALLINDVQLQHLSQCANILDRIKYIDGAVVDGILTPVALMRAFQVKMIFIASSVYNSADDGQTASGTRAFSDTYAQLLYVSSKDDIEDNPQIGRTMTLDTDPESPGVEASSQMQIGGGGVIVEEYSETNISSKVIRAKFFREAKIINSDCGFLLKSVA